MASSKQTQHVNGSTGSVVQRALSDLLGRFKFADRAGLAYGGRRDYDAALGYLQRLTPADYRSRYERGGVARRVVRAFPEATWASGAALVEDDDPEVTTEFEAAFAELVDRLAVWPRLRRADVLSGLGRFGLLLVGAPGDLATEMPRLSSPEDVLYFQAFSEESVSGIEFDTDVESPRFGLPVAYSVSVGAPSFVSGTSQIVRTQTVRVHWTRAVHVADDLLDNDVYGEPRLRPVWNYLDDLTKVVGGGSEAAWKRADPGLWLNADKDLMLDEGEVEAMESDVEDYIHGLTRVVRSRGIDLELLQSSVSSFGQNADSIVKLISATTGIPARILTGSERGELASTQDRHNFNDRVAARRQSFAEPLVRELVSRLTDAGALPEVGDYDVVWPDVEELDETEKAEVADRLAAANLKQVQATGVTIVTSAEIRDVVLGLVPMEEAGGVDAPGAVGDLVAAKLRVQRRRALLAVEVPVVPGADVPTRVRLIHDAADRNAGKVAAVVLASWVTGAQAMPADTLAMRIETRNVPAVNALIGDAAQAVREEMGPALRDAVLATMVDSAESELAAARRRDSFVTAQVETEFDAANPRAVEIAEAIAAELVVEVTPEVIEALRALVVEGLAQGIPPLRLAQRIRLAVGLRFDQLAAISNLRNQLIASRPGTLVTRFPPQPTLRDIPGFRARVPAGGATDAWLDRQLARYSRMQLNLRARTIARTETMRAANAGLRELWRQAVEQGQLPADTKRVWMTSLDDAVREEHAALEGEIVGIDEPFSGGFEPGEPPNCRCGHGIVSGSTTS